MLPTAPQNSFRSNSSIIKPCSAHLVILAKRFLYSSLPEGKSVGVWTGFILLSETCAVQAGVLLCLCFPPALFKQRNGLIFESTRRAIRVVPGIKLAIFFFLRKYLQVHMWLHAFEYEIILLNIIWEWLANNWCSAIAKHVLIFLGPLFSGQITAPNNALKFLGRIHRSPPAPTFMYVGWGLWDIPSHSLALARSICVRVSSAAVPGGMVRQ